MDLEGAEGFVIADIPGLIEGASEGVDIASLDMVMFLRPTESPTVFLQQLGRGLRISKGKELSLIHI